MRRYLVVAAAVFTALALAGAALAAEPRPQGYQGPGESVQGQVGNQGGGVAGEEAGFGSLPFSGLDLTLLAAGGAALILAGGGFYRLSRRRQ
jgi:hypothetical protein